MWSGSEARSLLANLRRSDAGSELTEDEDAGQEKLEATHRLDKPTGDITHRKPGEAHAYNF